MKSEWEHVVKDVVMKEYLDIKRGNKLIGELLVRNLIECCVTSISYRLDSVIFDGIEITNTEVSEYIIDKLYNLISFDCDLDRSSIKEMFKDSLNKLKFPKCNCGICGHKYLKTDEDVLDICCSCKDKYKEYSKIMLLINNFSSGILVIRHRMLAVSDTDSVDISTSINCAVTEMTFKALSFIEEVCKSKGADEDDIPDLIKNLTVSNIHQEQDSSERLNKFLNSLNKQEQSMNLTSIFPTK